jgi:hypothetical protein
MKPRPYWPGPKHALQSEQLGSATLTIALVFFVNIFLFRLVLALTRLLATLLLLTVLALLSSLAALAMLPLAELTSLLAFLFHVLIFHVVRHQDFLLRKRSRAVLSMN